MNWRYSGSEQLDEPDYFDEDAFNEEIDREEEAEEMRREMNEYD